MTKTLIAVSGVLLLLAIAVRLLEAFLRGSKRVYQYERRENLMTRAECECYHALVAEMGSNYAFFPQVHLDCIVTPKASGRNKLYAFRHINQKSVDFVACDKQDSRPLLAIERDKEVERILRDAGIPLVRIENRGRFDQKELSRVVRQGLSAS